MLKITLVESYDNVPANTVKDCDYVFNTGYIQIDEHALNIVKYIEDALDITPRYFLDRFGFKLYLSNLSTGSKTALLVNSGYGPVCLAECGFNALDAIINYCHGHVVLQDPFYSFTDFGDGGNKEFEINGVRIIGIQNLNEYLGV